MTDESSAKLATDSPRVDWVSFGITSAVVILVCVPLLLFSDSAARYLQIIYDAIAAKFGVVYLVAAVAAIGFLIWLASSRYGKLRLGEQKEAPEFSTFSWMSMLFCAGVGAGLMFWCMTEWVHYYLAPPFGATPRGTTAAEWASTYGLFHWGFSAWALYALPTIAIAYPYYAKRLSRLRFSTSCHHFVAGHEEGGRARFIDLFFMIGLIGGAGSSLGFSTPMIAAGLSRLFGWQQTIGLEIAVVAFCVALFAGSVWLGLKKGIQRLSNFNLLLAFALLAFVLLVGPTVFLLKTSVNGVGLMVQNFLRMSLWTDPFTESGFVESWTVFYWAWWVAYAPFVGLFVTRISRGRTIRQVIVGMLVLGSLGSWVFYMILGNFSLYLELEGALGVTELMAQGGGDAVVVATLAELPLPWLSTAVFCLVSIIFAATTYDSASYTLASGATLGLGPGEDPARWQRLFWAIALGVLPIALMLIGGLRTAQTAVLVVSLPILIIGVVMTISLMKTLKESHGS